MPTKPLTEKDREIILKALEENDYGIRPAHRALKEAGHKYGQGSVFNVAKEHKSGETIQSRLAAAESQIRTQKNKMAYLKRLHGESLRFNDEILAAIQTMPKLTPPTKKRIPKGTTPVDLGILLGDWHIGETIDFEEMDGFNKFNIDIAKRRIKYFNEKALGWVDLARRTYPIRKCRVVILGDMINGNIHPEEYAATNDLTVPEQCVTSGQMLADMLLPWIKEFMPTKKEDFSIEVDMIGADNHARLTVKPQTRKPQGTATTISSQNTLRKPWTIRRTSNLLYIRR